MSETTKHSQEENKGGVATAVAPSPKLPPVPEGVILGSRKVRIKHVEKFSILPKDPAIRLEVVKNIGSMYKKGTRDVIRGLSKEEEKEYLPSILGVQPTSEQWNDKVLNYWLDFVIKVPAGEKGVELEAGLERDSKGKIHPIDLDGYMKYNFCKENRNVAVSKEELENKAIKTFYIEDLSEVKREQLAKSKIIKDIEMKFVKLIHSTSPEERVKIDYILRIAGGENQKGMYVSPKMDDDEKELELRKLRDEAPSVFSRLINDPHLQTRALLQRALSAREVTMEGSSYYMADIRIGTSELDAIGWLEDNANSSHKSKLIARLKALNA